MVGPNYHAGLRNEFSAARLNNALNVVNVDPATGRLVARLERQARSSSAVRSFPAPIRTASPTTSSAPNGPSAASINYLNVFGVMTGRTSEQIADVNVTGDLGKMGVQFPWANDGVGINVGYEYRQESLAAQPGPGIPDG